MELTSVDQSGSVKQYAGDWYEDKREGFGLMLYNHQESYEGEWLNDKREGWGRMTYRDGSYYEAHTGLSPPTNIIFCCSITITIFRNLQILKMSKIRTAKLYFWIIM